MFKIKHFLDAVEEDDGQRLWVEPIGLTRDLQEMCTVSQIVPEIGPPITAWKFFEQHADAYDRFRAEYHESLTNGPHARGLRQLVSLARSTNITLLHHGDDPGHNTATALYEFLAELEAYSQPE